jgi:DNA-directed RNA polymerase subunit M/transcription elongation factor TFIIS
MREWANGVIVAASDHLLSLAKQIEASVFAIHKKTDMPYKRRMQVLFLNLKNKDNNLRWRVVSGEVTPERLSTMESAEMASAERRKEDEKLMQENMRTAMMAKSGGSISDQLTCGKCGKKKVSYTQAQTRSADEPMTTVCFSLARWAQDWANGEFSFALARTVDIGGSSRKGFPSYYHSRLERKIVAPFFLYSSYFLFPISLHRLAKMVRRLFLILLGYFILFDLYFSPSCSLLF